MDMLVIKTSKKSSLLPRMVVLVFAMIFGVYICFICINQINTRVKPKYFLRSVETIEKPYTVSGIQPQESLYLHYPQPKSYSRGECICNPVRFFAILSTQRSGSGWFETLLNSHINISSNGEIFSVKERRSNVSTVLKTLDKVYDLDWSSSAAKNECSAAVGFKWMLNQGVLAYHKEIVEYFNFKGVSAIFLFRKNHLRRMISVLANAYDKDVKLLNGTHKSHVHSTTEAQVLAQYRPTINTTLLVRNLRSIEEMTTNALEYFNSTRHIILYYEDLTNNRTKLMDVQEFLRVPPRDLESHQVRIHTKPLSEHVENWNEVYNTLKGTRYASFLNDTNKPI